MKILEYEGREAPDPVRVFIAEARKFFDGRLAIHADAGVRTVAVPVDIPALRFDEKVGLRIDVYPARTVELLVIGSMRPLDEILFRLVAVRLFHGDTVWFEESLPGSKLSCARTAELRSAVEEYVDADEHAMRADPLN